MPAYEEFLDQGSPGNSLLLWGGRKRRPKKRSAEPQAPLGPTPEEMRARGLRPLFPAAVGPGGRAPSPEEMRALGFRPLFPLKTPESGAAAPVKQLDVPVERLRHFKTYFDAFKAYQRGELKKGEQFGLIEGDRYLRGKGGRYQFELDIPKGAKPETLMQLHDKERERLSRLDAQRQKESELSTAREQLKDSAMPNAEAVLRQLGANIGAMASSAAGDVGTMGRLQRKSAAIGQAIEEQEQQSNSWTPAWLKRAARGVAVMLPTMVAGAAVAGPYGATGLAAADEADRAMTEGWDAGLKGPELTRYIAGQGVIEAVPAIVFQRLGLGGVEKQLGKLFGKKGAEAASIGIVSGLKKAGITALEEVPEELITELGHNVASSFSGVDPEATTPGRLLQTAFDTTVQTLMTVGLVESPQIAPPVVSKAKEAVQNRREIWETVKQKVKKGEAPSRREVNELKKEAELPEGDTDSAKQREEYVREHEEEIEQIIQEQEATLEEETTDAVQEQETAPPDAGDRTRVETEPVQGPEPEGGEGVRRGGQEEQQVSEEKPPQEEKQVQLRKPPPPEPTKPRPKRERKGRWRGMKAKDYSVVALRKEAENRGLAYKGKSKINLVEEIKDIDENILDFAEKQGIIPGLFVEEVQRGYREARAEWQHVKDFERRARELAKFKPGDYKVLEEHDWRYFKGLDDAAMSLSYDFPDLFAKVKFEDTEDPMADAQAYADLLVKLGPAPAKRETFRLDNPQWLQTVADRLESELGDAAYLPYLKEDIRPEDIEQANVELEMQPPDWDAATADELADWFMRENELAEFGETEEARNKRLRKKEEKPSRKKRERWIDKARMTPEEFAKDKAQREKAAQEEAAPKTKAEKLDRLYKESSDALDTINQLIKKKKITVGVDPELIRAVAKYVAAQVKIGVTRFQVLMENVAESQGAEYADEIRPLMARVWNSYQKRLGPEGMELAPEETPHPPPEGPSEPSGPPETELMDVAETVYSLKNAMVEVQRAVRGEAALPPTRETSETFSEWVEDASGMLLTDPDLPNKLVAKIATSTDVLTEREHAAMLLHYVRLQNELESATKEFVAASEAGDTAAKKLAADRQMELLEKIRSVESATKEAGTRASYSLMARKVVLAADYSLAGLTRRVMASKGAALTSEELATLQKLAEQIKGWQDQFEDLLIQDAFDATVAEAREEVKRGAGPAPEGRGPGAEPIPPAERPGRRRESKRRRAARSKKDAAVAKLRESLKSFARGETATIGGFPPEVIRDAANVAAAYMELGVVTFQEYFQNLKVDLGEDEAAKYHDLAREGWKQAKLDFASDTFDVTTEETEEIYDLAYKMVKSIVTSWAEEGRTLEGRSDEEKAAMREEIADQVHGELSEMFGESWSRLDTLKAIAAYDRFRPLNKTEVLQEVRRIRGELTQIARLIDIENGKAPPKKGMEQYRPEDEQRRLEKKVREAMKLAKFGPFDPARRLKTTLSSVKTAIRNSIRDMQYEIAHKERITRDKVKLEEDAELKELRRQLAEVKKLHRQVFPKAPPTEEELERRTVKTLDRLIKNMEKDLAEGRIWGKPRTVRRSEAIDARRARLEALKAEREALRQKERPDYAYNAQLQKRLADYLDRIARGDFAKRRRPERQHTQEQLDVLYKIEQAKKEIRLYQEVLEREKFNTVERGFDMIARTLNTSRAVLTSFEFSGLLRQGGWVAASHPKLTKNTVRPMIESALSDQSHFEVMEEIRNRENAPIYYRAGLAITDILGDFTAQEEAYAGHLFKKAGTGGWLGAGVRGSERAYVTVLNKMRADLFDQMADKIARDREITMDEAKLIADYVNIATGRGPLGALERSAQNLGITFFAPRYVMSRFQLMIGYPLWKPLKKEGHIAWGDANQARKLIAKEYGRALMGYGLFYGSLALIGGAMAAMGADDDNIPKIEINPLSTDFGKIRFGNTRLDPLAGLSQTAVVSSQVILGKRKTAGGRVVALRGPERPYGGRTTMGTVGRFMRTKLSPWLGGIANYFNGENIVGEKVTAVSLAKDALIPITTRDIYEAMREQGVPKGAALSLLAIFGVGLQTYQARRPAPKRRKLRLKLNLP